MADFCSLCEESYFDINLAQTALELDRGHSINFLCEGCQRKCLYKDDDGILYIGTLVEGKIVLRSHKVEEL